MKQYILMIAVCAFLINCTYDRKPKTVHSEHKGSETTELLKDSTLVEIADLPIQIDSTDYLLHPIGEYRVYQSRSKISFGSSDYHTESFSVANHSGYMITGDIHNVKFQHTQADTLYPLTDTFIKITRISFLRDIYNTTKEQYLVYTVIDKDTNKDQKLDHNDVETLFISGIDGKRFTKFTGDLWDLIDWKTVASQNRLYFRSIEDTNHNGEFDKEDQIHYQYVDLSDPKWTVTSYHPI